MRPPCHRCKTKPADYIENKVFWCAVCKVHDLRVRGEIKPEVLTKPTKYRRVKNML